MAAYTLKFQEISKTKLELVGGKGANLGELSSIPMITVPDGFCITTEAYRDVVETSGEFTKLLEKLLDLNTNDNKRIIEIGTSIRKLIGNVTVPRVLDDEIDRHLRKYGDDIAYAVRSSATAEDLPSASFAGLQDTYLNIRGKEQVMKHICMCWASLFTDRAILYRMKNGFDHRKVRLSVVIQKMVFPEVSGILFTADPVTGNRKVLSIDAGFGLGEALVSGLVNADVYKVRNRSIIDKKVSAKKLAIYPLKEGGTKEVTLGVEQQNKQVLTEHQILKLEHIGRMVEKHFGRPQDIEWCLADNEFHIVQSRAITTLYPIPNSSGESDNQDATGKENQVYVSVGHQQMMTDALKPLGLSLWQLTAARPMFIGGGRLFVNLTEDLASPARREIIVNVLGKSDPLIKDALMTVMERNDFMKPLAGDDPAKTNQGPPPENFQKQIECDPGIVQELISRSQASIEELKQNIQAKSGTDLIDFILEDHQKLRKSLFEQKSIGVIMASINASFWINDKLNDWLGEKNAADTLSQSLPNNVTSEMGLSLLDVADVIRPHQEVIEYLQRAKDDNFFEGLAPLNGGKETAKAIKNYLNKYGMRCVGEIDITRTRWSEKPTTLVPMILSNVKNLEPYEGKRKFDRGLQEALEKEKDLLKRLESLPDGEEKARETKKMIDLVRNYAGYREYPKYDIVSRYFIYKHALLKEADRLLQNAIIREKEDVYYLRLDELLEVIRTNKLDYYIISKRKEEYKSYEKLTPPRVITSDGEIITGRYKRENLPVGAMVGLPVSSGLIEGRARVILNMEDADLEEGDILVTTFTDPSWTPLFLSIKGLITEVGGLMTHGAVIAREYGLPAVVGVENATVRIKDGQRIRVHGTEGYVEIIEPDTAPALL